MNYSVALIEVGSTNTKGFIYKNGAIEDLPISNIQFKKHYLENNCIKKEDEETLFSIVNQVKDKVDEVYTFGTSIFRDLKGNQRNEFLNAFKERTGFEFNICSLEDENEYTVKGAINGLNYDKNVAVLVVGGGSVEISICNKENIIESANTSFGVIDIANKFPDLKEDYASSNIDEVVQYATNNLNLPEQKADVLILAGGNHILYHESAKYPLEKNIFFEDNMHPYLINYKDKIEYDLNYYYKTNLNDLRIYTPNSPNWWNETRGVCAVTECVANKLNAKYIIPTKINMMYYILDKKLEEKLNS